MIGKSIAALALAGAAALGAADSASASARYYGNPHSADSYWQLQTTGDCVEQSVRKAVDMVEGRPVVSESRIDAFAASAGIYRPGYGTFSSAWPSLIAYYGARFSGPSPTSRARLGLELAKGAAVIVTLNAETVWAQQGYTVPASGLWQADHAVVVEAVSKSGGSVVLSDGGVPTGRHEVVPWATFSRAWSVSGYSAVAVWK